MGSTFRYGQLVAKPLLKKLKFAICIVLLSYSAVVADDFSEQTKTTASEPSHTGHQFVPTKPMKVVFASSGSSEILKDGSVQLGDSDGWQEFTLYFAPADLPSAIQIMELEIFPPAASRSNGDKALMLFDLKPWLKHKSGKKTGLEFVTCKCAGSADDDSTANCIDGLSDTGWKIPAFSERTTSHRLVLQFAEPIVIDNTSEIGITIDAGGSANLGTLSRVRVSVADSTANSPDVDETTATPGTRKVITANEVPLSFRWCPPGEFLMGSPEDKREQYGDAFVTQHRVKISRGFWLQETEITQAQYEMVTGKNPSFWRSKIVSSDPVIARQNTNDNPVEQVSWTDASSFCEELAKLDVKHRFRLPTEAEWEYACRAGQPECGYGEINDIAWVFENTEGVVGEGSIGHMAVGRKTPNAWGLYDLLGNVSECCSDWLGPPAMRPAIDPTGPSAGTYRVARGGNCFADRGELRTEGLCMAGTRDRDAGRPHDTIRTRGFRIVLVANGNQNGPPSASFPSSRSKRTEANQPDAHFVVRRIRQLADDSKAAANAHVFESQKFVDVDTRESLLTEADILLFGALMTQENDQDSHMNLILTDESKATTKEAWNQVQSANDVSKQLGVFLNGDLLGVVNRFSSTTGLPDQIRDSSISMRMKNGAAVSLRKFLTQSCFHSPCQMRAASTDVDGVKLKARLLVQRSKDGKYHVVTDWGVVNSSPAERTLRIVVAGREIETRTLKPGEFMHLYVPVHFQSQDIHAGKFNVTPSVTSSGEKYQLVSTISMEREGKEETTIKTTSPKVMIELSQ